MKKISLIICILFLGALFTASAFAADKAPLGSSAPMSSESTGQTEKMAPAVPPVGAPGEKPYTSPSQGATKQYGEKAGLVGTASFNISDKKVRTSDGEEFGSVKDVIIGSNGEVRYLIVDHGGVLGIGEKLTPVPWSVVSKTDKDAIVLNVTKDRLAQAPTISKDEMANLDSAEWNQKVHGYYGETGTTGGTPGVVKEMMKEGQEKAKGMMNK